MSSNNAVQGGPAITVYTSYDCQWCVKSKEYLRDNGFSYEEKNVEDDAAVAEEALALTGHRGVPIIVIDDRVIMGFKRHELDAALNIGG